MPAPTIRPIRPEDRAAWARLWGAYLEFYETALPAEVYQATFSRLLDPGAPDMKALIAEAGGTPVGLVHSIFHRHCWRAEDVCYLQDRYVVPEARSTGTGRALIEAVYGAADTADAPSVYWLTQEANATARQLYDRVGQLTPFVKYVRG